MFAGVRMTHIYYSETNLPWSKEFDECSFLTYDFIKV